MGMSKYRNPSKITELIIHCATTPNGKHFDAYDIDDWHAEFSFKRGAAFVDRKQPRLHHIGYHFVIDLNGHVTDARHINETGAHAKGHNNKSIGICLIGTDQFTEQQWLALKHQVQALQNRFPDIKIIGHNQISKKTCPGFDVPAWLAADMRPLIEHLYNLNAHE